MEPSILVGIVAIAVAVGTYFLGKRHERRETEANKCEARINRFVDDYVDRSRRHINTGITALVPAGVCRLGDDGEIREALDICGKQLGKHPLGENKGLLEDVDLKQFFEFVASEGNFATDSVEQALARFQTTDR